MSMNDEKLKEMIESTLKPKENEFVHSTRVLDETHHFLCCR